MRIAIVSLMMALGGIASCGKKADPAVAGSNVVRPVAMVDPPIKDYVGFDRNDYPGDDAMAELKKQFAYTGYWLTPPPGETVNGWVGKREILKAQGYGFLVLANGRFDQQIKAAKMSPEALGKKDAAAAIAAAKAEGFPAKTILFLDQEEGGRLLAEQAGYLFGWTEAIAASDFRPGVYASGQPAPDEPGKTITTIQDIREHIAKDHLHPIAIWVYQDACAPAGPAPGCVITPPSKDASGTPEVMVWQYAQSPRRPEVTQSCAKTYGTDGNCYAPGSKLLIDMNVAGSADPSHGR
ncbi:protein of unknown function [Granulicella pectinivorans]|uniref:Rv2525c-like glycoside hydrolase-like domain-containing protein n=1 Tax=Granulicella pectinivorans TaxID=474950 RepID=A0A1I6LAG6_9BACT|nr:glycoside hydrolase domain-containing protein [Granulicella pectinivorans]SFS00419.1 protein of unknown function [Granulicella pectinivorans]